MYPARETRVATRLRAVQHAYQTLHHSTQTVACGSGHGASFLFIPDLTNHSHARNLTRKLIEREFSDEQIAKILFENWMRIFAELL